MSIYGNWEQQRVEAVSRMGEMDRRTFVKLGGTSAAALIFGYGPFTESVWSPKTRTSSSSTASAATSAAP